LTASDGSDQPYNRRSRGDVTGVYHPNTAAANGCWIGAINRVGTEAPWSIGEFYGQSYFVNPRGQIEKIASRDKDELIVHDLDMRGAGSGPPSLQSRRGIRLSVDSLSSFREPPMRRFEPHLLPLNSDA
jgi:predicted amidohydrolase